MCTKNVVYKIQQILRENFFKKVITMCSLLMKFQGLYEATGIKNIT